MTHFHEKKNIERDDCTKLQILHVSIRLSFWRPIHCVRAITVVRATIYFARAASNVILKICKIFRWFYSKDQKMSFTCWRVWQFWATVLSWFHEHMIAFSVSIEDIFSKKYSDQDASSFQKHILDRMPHLFKKKKRYYSFSKIEIPKHHQTAFLKKT